MMKCVTRNWRAFLVLGPVPFVLSFLAWWPAPAAQDAKNAPPPAFECRWADGPITIDGKADEAGWKHAQVIDHFYLPWLGADARPAKTRTLARLLWDRE